MSTGNRSKKRDSSVTNSESAIKRRRCEDPKEISQQTKNGKFGIIESVSLCNFMCHDNLEFKFGPNINFIIGQNGSGKSAILTAIILALGGRSSVTGRYPNVKGFIKTDKQKAKIEVVLKNGGSNPFKPELYGSKITVIREINSDGVSSYKLKSSSGKLVSHHREELTCILNAMDIQIENPVSALTQESSRSFLMSRKPDKMYQFFYQGSGLETLEKRYNDIRLLKEEAAEELQRKREMLPSLEKELRTWKNILDTSAKILYLKNELLWARVIEMEKELMKKEKEFADAKTELATFQSKRDHSKKELDDKISKLDELQKKRDECDAGMAEHRNKITLLKNEHKNCSDKCQNLKGKFDSCRREEHRIYNDILSMENHINENLMKDQNELNEDKRLRKNKIKQLQQQLENYDQAMKEFEKKRESKMQLREDLTAKRNTLVSEINSFNFSLAKEREELNRCQTALLNRVNVFGGPTQNVLNEIQKQRNQFSKIPKGPIGRFLEVKNPKWCAGVQHCISTSLLRAYCCDNEKDSLVLKGILKKFYPDYIPTVLIVKYLSKMYDIKEFKIKSIYPTVLEMLTINDPVIANALIDNAYIERKILIEDTNTATKVMRNPPEHCSGAIMLDCRTIEINPFRLYSSEGRSQKSLLSSVGKGEIQTLKTRMSTTANEVECRQTELNSLPGQIAQISKEMEQLNKDIVKCKLNKSRITEEIKDLKIIEDPKCRHDQEDLKQFQMEYEKKKAERQNYELKFKEFKSKIDNLQEEINMGIEVLQDESRKYNDLCSNLDKVGQDKERFASVVSTCAKKIKECEIKLKPLEKEVVEDRQRVEVAVNNAEEVCPRIDTDQSVERLSRILSETEKVVEQQSQCNRKDLQKKYIEKCENLKEAKRKLSSKECAVALIDKMYNQRREHFRAICLQTQLCIRTGFMICLRDEYHAQLEFDSKARTLNLEVRPKKSGSKLKRGGKCSSLSGGERSYVTIAFLLSMWDRIKSPFKILDEYDVFMDSNNRKLSIDLLIAHAGLMADAQFIFLSPLDLPQIPESPLIKIHQMPAPARVEPIYEGMDLSFG